MPKPAITIRITSETIGEVPPPEPVLVRMADPGL
jgi:hypothetical protein